MTGPKLVARDGQQIAAPPRGDTLADAINDVVSRVEGGRRISKYFLVIEFEHEGDASLIDRNTWDSGLTVSEAMYVLECTKLDLMMAMRMGPSD